jgi:hypothetical protein
MAFMPFLQRVPADGSGGRTQPRVDAAVVLAAHARDRVGKCQSCSEVLGRAVAWPCSFVSLAELALKIVRGEIGER